MKAREKETWLVGLRKATEKHHTGRKGLYLCWRKLGRQPRSGVKNKTAQQRVSHPVLSLALTRAPLQATRGAVELCTCSETQRKGRLQQRSTVLFSHPPFPSFLSLLTCPESQKQPVPERSPGKHLQPKPHKKLDWHFRGTVGRTSGALTSLSDNI